MTELDCKGDEARITDCNFKTYNEEKCSYDDVAGVMCAKCTQTDLLGIVNSIELGTQVADTRKTIDAAVEKLATDCYPWDCSSAKQAYPEFCLVHSFLNQAQEMVSHDMWKNHVSLQFDTGSLLDHAYTKESNSKIIDELNKIAEQLDNFQTDLADYFSTMADFDKNKAQADLTYNSGVWSSQRASFHAISLEVGDQLGKLFKTAYEVQEAEWTETAVQIGLGIASLWSPVDAVFNPGEIAEKFNTIIDYLQEFASEGVQFKHLKYVFETVFPKFRELAEDIEKQMTDNLDSYKDIARIVGIGSADELSEEDADLFLKLYNGYSPAITTEQLARYEALLDETVQTPCDIVEGDGGVAAGFIRMTVTELCPDLRVNAEVLKALLESQADIQMDIMDSFVDIARAKVSARSARELSEVFGRGSMDVLEGAIASKNTLVIYQLHKVQLIADACDTIKYINYGEEQEFCARMRADPSGDLGHLISYKYDENFQCQDSRSRSMIFSIPAVTRRRNESIPEGTLDLSQLMQGKSVLFRIPDKQWLVEHGWIGEDEIGPVFVKQLDLYPLPEMSNDVVVNSATFILINNTLNGEEIVFDRRLSATFSRQENFVDCFNPPELASPYNVANCDKYKTACRTATGTFGSGNIYPSLIGSLWSVKFDLPSKPAMPYPKTPFFLKVYATICNVKNTGEQVNLVWCGVVGCL